MKKSQLVGLITIVVIVLTGAYFLLADWLGGSPDLLGEAVTLYQYTLDGAPTGGAIVSIPFAADTEREWLLNILVDVNDDGAFDPATEWITKNQVARVYRDYRNNFVLTLSGVTLNAGDTRLVRAVLSENAMPEIWNGEPNEMSQDKTVNTAVENFDMGVEIGLNVPGASEELKRGPVALFSSFVSTSALAQGSGSSGAFRGPPMPDIRQQGPMDCTPTATTNNLISLAREHGRGNDLPNQQQMINELRQDMQFNNGVLLGNITAGKDAFVERYNLPVVSERIDNPTVAQMTQAIQNGCVAELSMAWIRSRSGHANTGHVVSLAGIATGANGRQQVQVHDPATPSGLDTYDLNAKIRTPSGTEFEGVNYPGWDGIAFIDAVIIQCWSETEPATTGTQVDTSRIETLVIGGSYYPKSQFHIAGLEGCGAPHWHANSGAVYGLQNKTSTHIVSATDPGPECGFGKVSEVPQEDIEISYEQSVELIKHVVP